MLVLPTAQVFAANVGDETDPFCPGPRFSACNSGSPRHKPVNGKGVPGPRGPDTFRLARDFGATPGLTPGRWSRWCFGGRCRWRGCR